MYTEIRVIIELAEQELKKIQIDKAKRIKDGQLDMAAQLRDREKYLLQHLEELKIKIQ